MQNENVKVVRPDPGSGVALRRGPRPVDESSLPHLLGAVQLCLLPGGQEGWEGRLEPAIGDIFSKSGLLYCREIGTSRK